MGLPGNKTPKLFTDNLKKCDQIINLLFAHKSAEPFLQPVDPVALGILDYPTIVKEPMDLGTIRRKLRSREYKAASQFVSDVRKVWHNSFLYNPKHTPIYQMTAEMSEYFEKLNKELNDGMGGDEAPVLGMKTQALAAKAKPFSSKLGPKTSVPKSSFADKPMTKEEKMSLLQMIKSSPQ